MCEIGLSIWLHLANLREYVKDQCQAIIEIITGGCVWYERGTDGKSVACKLCKRQPDSVEHFLNSCTMFKNDVNDVFNYVCKDILIDNFEYMTLGCKIASRMFDLLKKYKALCRGD